MNPFAIRSIKAPPDGGTGHPAAVLRWRYVADIDRYRYREAMATNLTLLERIARGDRAAVALCIKQRIKDSQDSATTDWGC